MAVAQFDRVAGVGVSAVNRVTALRLRWFNSSASSDQNAGEAMMVTSVKAVFASLAAIALVASSGLPSITPIRLHSGTNPISNIAGDGVSGSISLDWRENGNAWSYDIYTVRVGGSVVTIDGADRLTDSPHTGEDVIKSVRFGRASYAGRQTLFALIAEREIVDSVPAPARTAIKVYALVQNDSGLGTPYEFKLIKRLIARRPYCNADMALQSEMGFPVAKSYSGAHSISGC